MDKKTLSMLGIALLVSACSTHQRVHVPYDDHAWFTGATPGNREYVEVAPVSATATGPARASCEELAQDAAQDLDTQVAELGGNSVIHLRWINLDDGSKQLQPECVVQWGWGGGLLPWAQVAEVEGIAVRRE